MTEAGLRLDVVSHVIRTRRTIGAFTAEPVPELVVQSALEAATWAPNHRKTEPWRFRWLGPETITRALQVAVERLAVGKSQAVAEAKVAQWRTIPGWMVVSCLRSDNPAIAEEDYAACCCAVQNFTLALWAAGVGSKWSTGDVAMSDAFLQLVGIDSGVEKMVGLVWFGFPAVTPQQTRKPVGAVLTRLP